MELLENLRKELHKIIESGDTESIISLSHELDKLILEYMKANYTTKKILVL